MQIRPITINDIDHFISLWNRVYEEGDTYARLRRTKRC